MKRFELLIFDWDGTIVDSIGSIVDCTALALEDCGVEGSDRAVIRGAIGLGIREMMETIVPGCDDDLFERICLAYRERWFGGFGTRHRPFEGVAELLTALRSDGYLLAVATAKSRRGLRADFERTRLGPCFHDSRTVDEAPAKPHPGMVESLVFELGVTPGRTLVIGDTTHDLEMAGNAGVSGVGVLTGSHGREDFEQVRHEAILESVVDLPGWLAQGGRLAAAR